MRVVKRLAILLLGWCGIFSVGSGQPDPRFEPFDWVNYRSVGAITSITEGFSYVYFGTQNGGILRYHLYRNDFDYPITKAQGLNSNHILAVYFDRSTGTLWAATDRGLEYSYTREGEWYRLSHDDLGLPGDARIRQIGSSDKHIWVLAGAMFLKLDRLAGIVLGMMPTPDEEGIQWSSLRFLPGMELPTELTGYTVMEGWLLNWNQFTDPYGRLVAITTVFQGQFNEYWLGTEDGSIFLGDRQMETLYPLRYGLASTDVTTLSHSDPFWIAGRYGYGNHQGITWFDPRRQIFDRIEFEVTINMEPQSFYSSLIIDDEVWIGGEFGCAVYDQQEGFWRFIDESRGLPSGPILTMAGDTGYVWVGSPNGLARLRIKTKRSAPAGIETLFRGRFIYDLELIQGQLWIGTGFGLYIYDIRMQTLHDFRSLGDFSRLKQQQFLLNTFWEITAAGDLVYIATPMGILTFDLKTQTWDLPVDPSQFRGERVWSMEVIDRWCFLGTAKGVTRIDLEQRHVRNYTYSFIGRVNDMYFSDNTLWLGTDQGLIAFNWQRDP
jgi:ligand-binding sensor domain-containing protein